MSNLSYATHGRPWQLSYNPSGSYLAVAIPETTGKGEVLGLNSKTLTKSFSFNAPAYSLAWSSESQLLTGNEDGSIYSFNYDSSPSLSSQYNFHTKLVSSLSVQDPTHFFSGSWDGDICYWDISKSKSPQSLFRAHTSHVYQVIPDLFNLNQFHSVSRDRSINVWSLNSKLPVITMENAHSHDILSIAQHPTNQYLFATASCDCLIKLWDIRSSIKPLSILSGHRWGIRKVIFNESGTLLASASFDSSIRFWDFNQVDFETFGEEEEAPENHVTDRHHTDFVYNICWHPTLPNLISSCSWDTFIYQWTFGTKVFPHKPVKNIYSGPETVFSGLVNVDVEDLVRFSNNSSDDDDDDLESFDMYSTVATQKPKLLKSYFDSNSDSESDSDSNSNSNSNSNTLRPALGTSQAQNVQNPQKLSNLGNLFSFFSADSALSDSESDSDSDVPRSDPSLNANFQPQHRPNPMPVSSLYSMFSFSESDSD